MKIARSKICDHEKIKQRILVYKSQALLTKEKQSIADDLLKLLNETNTTLIYFTVNAQRIRKLSLVVEQILQEINIQLEDRKHNYFKFCDRRVFIFPQSKDLIGYCTLQRFSPYDNDKFTYNLTLPTNL